MKETARGNDDQISHGRAHLFEYPALNRCPFKQNPRPFCFFLRECRFHNKNTGNGNYGSEGCAGEYRATLPRDSISFANPRCARPGVYCDYLFRAISNFILNYLIRPPFSDHREYCFRLYVAVNDNGPKVVSDEAESDFPDPQSASPAKGFLLHLLLTIYEKRKRKLKDTSCTRILFNEHELKLVLQITDINILS